MLIFFIVTTSFVKESGVTVNRPSAQTAEEKKGSNILVAIRANGEIWIDRRAIDVRAVRPNIERMKAENPEGARSEEHTSELQSRPHLVCRLLLEKKKKNKYKYIE